MLYMPWLCTFILLFLFSNVDSVNKTPQQNETDPNILEDVLLSTCTFVRKYEYPCEIHTVITKDEYVLEVHRIPYGKYNNDTNTERPAVLLMHGFLSTSADFILLYPGNALAFILADAGYDVWMGNARGNPYSQKHIYLSASSRTFWLFNLHEIGFYDLPATIDYVINETGFSKIHYVGFSQGTTAFWIMASTRPEYNDKIIAVQALAPIAYLDHIRSPIYLFTSQLNVLQYITVTLFGPDQLFPNEDVNELLGRKLCLREAKTKVVCDNVMFLIVGYDSVLLNSTTLPVVLGHIPASISTRQFIHFEQLVISKRFRRFDFGPLTNKIIYGTFSPPNYNLSAIRTPVYIYYADNDWLATTEDVNRLLGEIKSIVSKYKVSFAKFNHLDFIIGTDAKRLLYDQVMRNMATYL